MDFVFDVGDTVGNIFDDDIGEVVAKQRGEVSGYPQYKVLFEDEESDWVLWFYEDNLIRV